MEKSWKVERLYQKIKNWPIEKIWKKIFCPAFVKQTKKDFEEKKERKTKDMLTIFNMNTQFIPMTRNR